MTADQSKSAQSVQAKKGLTERVGDWLCLNCNNLNFGFRDFCNRCELDRLQVGKTIMSEHELESLQQQAPASHSIEQIHQLCEMAIANATRRAPLYPQVSAGERPHYMVANPSPAQSQNYAQ